MKLTEAFRIRETLDPEEKEPKHWGGIPDDSRVTLHKWLLMHQNYVNVRGDKNVDSSLTGNRGKEANYIMFVDDFEGLGLRDAIADNDLKTAEIISMMIMKKYPPSRYNPFSNNFQGTGPESSERN
jgi:hypothetical protein